MIANTSALLRRSLSPEAYNHVRYYWWQGSFYLPRRLASRFVRHAPTVHGFPSNAPASLAGQLRGVNVFAPTPLCRTMTRHGSDKGQGWHNYTTIYAELLAKLRGDKLRILELGLGTNNPTLASSMGAGGRPGASLRGWREIFPEARIYGADIDRDILFEEERIQTFYCDQCDAVAIQDLWDQPALREAAMDIIIDDGLHTFEGNISFLEGSLAHLRPGGIYVIEDLLQETVPRWLEVLQNVYAKRFPGHEFALVELPNARNRGDNNLLIVRSRGQAPAA
jgi:hypothetical protein